MSEAAPCLAETESNAFRTPYYDAPRSSSAPPPSGHVRCADAQPSPDIGGDPLSSFWRQYPQAWRAMQELLGDEEALQVAQLQRNDAMTTLRVKHRWSLQAIGDLFDLSRERVRQLTPSIEGNGITPDADDGIPSDPRTIRRHLGAAFREAVRTPHAWNGRGQVSKSWITEQLGYEPDLPDLDFRRLADSKTEFILRYGLGLETKRDMETWLKEMYFERHMTYAEIARWLSQRFVSLAPMTVHRYAMGILDIGGFGRGKRADR